MKNSMRSAARMLMLFVALSITGSLNAHPRGPGHPPKKYRYYYYPKQNVYYDPVESVYFVWDRSYWKPVSAGYFSVAFSSAPRFELWMASTHPYYYNVEHRRTYYAYRVPRPAPRPAPAPRVYAESRPKPNVSFHVEFNPVVVHPHPEPVYVEERVIIKEHDRGHHHPGHGPRHHPGHGRGRGHH